MSNEHRVPNTPVNCVLPLNVGSVRWRTSCSCGWGALCDSPEAAVIGLATHLRKTLTMTDGEGPVVNQEYEGKVDDPADCDICMGRGYDYLGRPCRIHGVADPLPWEH